MSYDYLYSKPGYLSGIARTLDLFGLFRDYNYSPSSDEHLRRALGHDWAAVGKSLQHAMDATAELNEFEQGYATELRRTLTEGTTALSPTFLSALEEWTEEEELRKTTYLYYLKALRAAAKRLVEDHETRERFRALLEDAKAGKDISSRDSRENEGSRAKECSKRGS